MPAKETTMIDLSEEQRREVQDGRAVRVRENGREYVLLRPDVYDRLSEDAFEDSPWNAEEMDRVREESVEQLDGYGK
jgi:hypothetical protein